MNNEKVETKMVIRLDRMFKGYRVQREEHIAKDGKAIIILKDDLLESFDLKKCVTLYEIIIASISPVMFRKNSYDSGYFSKRTEYFFDDIRKIDYDQKV